eukprot:SM000038S14361  [mRNA]  locus=s38:395581:398367:- [translate_table: standard]
MWRRPASRNVEELALVDNATTATVIVAQYVADRFHGGEFAAGDIILVLDCTYAAVKNVIERYIGRAMGQVVEVPIPFPLSADSEVVDAFEEVLARLKKTQPAARIRLAVLDHVTSMPSVVLPLRTLVSMVRAASPGVLVLVDGAHAIGNVDIDLLALGADFYTSNLHKWAFAPPGAAFLHALPEHLAALHHPIVSHNLGKGLAREAAWTGTKDYSALLAVPAALEFWKAADAQYGSLKDYNKRQVLAMAEMLAGAWGTMLGTPEAMCSSVAMVGLPSAVEAPIYFCTTALEAGDPVTAYVRISHQIYNTEGDYIQLRDAVNDMVVRWQNVSSMQAPLADRP